MMMSVHIIQQVAELERNLTASREKQAKTEKRLISCLAVNKQLLLEKVSLLSNSFGVISPSPACRPELMRRRVEWTVWKNSCALGTSTLNGDKCG